MPVGTVLLLYRKPEVTAVGGGHEGVGGTKMSDRKLFLFGIY